MKKELIIGMAFSAAILSSCGPTTPQLGKSPINEVINAMTLEEKAGMCSGLDFWHLKSVERLGIPEVCR